jgi:hypothetical protein
MVMKKTLAKVAVATALAAQVSGCGGPSLNMSPKTFSQYFEANTIVERCDDKGAWLTMGGANRTSGFSSTNCPVDAPYESNSCALAAKSKLDAETNDLVAKIAEDYCGSASPITTAVRVTNRVKLVQNGKETPLDNVVELTKDDFCSGKYPEKAKEAQAK